VSHFYGTLQRSRGEATRCGTKNSGVTTWSASWEGAVHVRLWYDEENDCDMAGVSLQPWHGSGVSRLLYYGPVDGEKEE
jgi:hypothetical protein